MSKGQEVTGTLFRRKKGERPIGVRVSMPDRTRPLVRFADALRDKPDLLARVELMSEEELAAVARVVSDEYRATARVALSTPETVNEWIERWIMARAAKGLRSSRRVDRGRYLKWIAPRLGTLPIAQVTRRHVEEVVQDLDLAVRAGQLSWKTAVNAWGVITKMFKDACRSKVLDLRVRDDNPAAEVQGPDRGAERSGPYLFPREFERLMASERVPVRWKRVFALATYLYVRGGELEALEWNSVNFAQGYALIHQAVDTETNEVKSTKTKDVRKVPLEAGIVPLLEEMHRDAGGEGRVVTAMPPAVDWAKKLRVYLERAGVDRADLFANDATRRQISFHDLRHTGITWRAVRGDDPMKIMRAAGHDDMRTTQRYINEAETFDAATFGTPFPPVPVEYLRAYTRTGTKAGTRAGTYHLPIRRKPGFYGVAEASPEGFEPSLAT